MKPLCECPTCNKTEWQSVNIFEKVKLLKAINFKVKGNKNGN